MDVITSTAVGIGLEKAGKAVADKATPVIDSLFRDPKLQDEILSIIKDQYENELFYNSFLKFIEEHKTIEHLIDKFNGDCDFCEEDFCKENLRKFASYYKYNPIEESTIRKVFSVIYNSIYVKKLNISRYSDVGKLQKDVHIIATENDRGREEIKQMMGSMMGSMMDSMMAGFKELANTLAPVKTNEEENCEKSSEKVKAFLNRVCSVGKDSQKSDSEIINEYLSLLAESAIELNNESTAQRNSVICKINSNIALRYSNLGNINKAFEWLAKIETDTAKGSATYHFVKAAIIINHRITDKFQEAYESIDSALGIDENYKQAWLLKSYFNALNKVAALEDTINLLDNKFKEVLDKNNDKSLISDYYTYRAFIFMEFDEYGEAIKNHLKAKECGYDEAVCDFNIGVAYYAIATERLPKNTRIWCGDINLKEMLKALEILKKWIFNYDVEISEYLKTRYIRLYVSVCCLLGIKHNLPDISRYLGLEFDYETRRLIILGTDSHISEKELSLLDEDDRVIANISNYIKTNDIKGIIEFVESKKDEEVSKLPQSILQLLLQACVISKKVELYEKIRVLIEVPVDVSLLECLDGYIEETKGNIEIAKSLLDKHAKETMDYHLLYNIMLFYERNNFDTEHSALLLRLLDLKIKKDIYIEDVVTFYGHSISFFIKAKSENIQFFIEDLKNDGDIPRINKLMFLADYYSSVGEQSKLLEMLTEIYEIQPTYKNGFNKAISLLHLMKYSEAVELGLELFESLKKGMDEEKSQIIAFICEVYLYLDEYDKSFEWAKKAHEMFIDTPVHSSHQNFLAIATRTNHFEALKDVVEYKKIHPVVAEKLIYQLEISESNPVESLKKALETITGEKSEIRVSRDNQFMNLHRNKILSNSMLLKYLNNSLLQYFDFGRKNKLHICDGNIQNLTHEQGLIKNDIFVDALTLIVLNENKCLEILNRIKNVHICYSTINVLHSFVSSVEYNSYIPEIVDWLKKSQNIIYATNGFEKVTEISDFLLPDMWACCQMSSKEGIPYLTVEHLVKNLQYFKEEYFSENLEIVSIPAFFYAVLSDNVDNLSEALWSLLGACSFISFRAETILYQIQKNKYNIEEESIERFFICDSNCDMVSFARIYVTVVNELCDEHFETSVAFAKIVLKNCMKIWRRGDYYRNVVKNIIDDPISRYRENAINQYVILIAYSIKQVYGDIPVEILSEFNELVSCITKNFTTEYVNQIISNLDRI